MDSIGICSLLNTSITVTNNTNPSELSITNPKQFLRYYIYGLHAKTKRTLAEEAECGDEISVVSWIKDGMYKLF